LFLYDISSQQPYLFQSNDKSTSNAKFQILSEEIFKSLSSNSKKLQQFSTELSNLVVNFEV